jgi:hypothetical protein
MTTVAILPVSDASGERIYRAIALRARYATRSQVISNQQVKPQVKRSPALTAQLEGSEFSTLLIIQSFRPDWFFSIEQQQRLSDLMNLWRTARDQGQTLSRT